MDKKGTVGEVGWVAHKILVSAQGPLVLVLILRVWGQGLTISLKRCEKSNCPKIYAEKILSSLNQNMSNNAKKIQDDP